MERNNLRFSKMYEVEVEKEIYNFLCGTFPRFSLYLWTI